MILSILANGAGANRQESHSSGVLKPERFVALTAGPISYCSKKRPQFGAAGRGFNYGTTKILTKMVNRWLTGMEEANENFKLISLLQALQS